MSKNSIPSNELSPLDDISGVNSNFPGNQLSNSSFIKNEVEALEKRAISLNSAASDRHLSQSQDRDKVSNRFPEDVYENLPALLKQACQILDQKEREVYLLGALAVGSGLLPNVLGHYGGMQYAPNLYLYLIGPYGEGKGGLSHARKLGEAIHQAKLGAVKTLIDEYKRQMVEYKKALKLFERGKGELPDEPKQPPHLKLFIQANSGSTAFKQLLNENDGRGIIFETEGDTLVGIFKHDYGNFSDDLRKAWGHESFGYFRRTGNEDVEISFPCLSVVLSSTFDQMLHLIPNIENGLFSRFMFYELESNPEFKDVFDKRKTGYGKYFSELGLEYQKIYNELLKKPYPIIFQLQPHQEQIFLETFRENKTEVLENITPALGGVINRLAVICFRIAMQLATLRAFENGDVSSTIICSDQDFENALRITQYLKKHILSVFYRLPAPRSYNRFADEDKDAVKVENKKKCIELKGKGFSVREIAVMVLGNESKKSTVARWINGN